MVWSVLIQILTELNESLDESKCCEEKVMDSEASPVSVSTVGIVVYISWGSLFLLLICILFILGLSSPRGFLT